MIKASHEAVMVNEVLENLVFEQNGKYVDCTFGAGGHSLEILKKILLYIKNLIKKNWMKQIQLV